MISNTKDEIIKTEMKTFIRNAQLQAHARHEKLGFCLADKANRCVAVGNYLLLFKPPSQMNNNLQMVMRKKIKITGFFKWRFFPRHQSYFIFSFDNHLDGSNGSIWYCLYHNSDPLWAIAINKIGHIAVLNKDEAGHIHDSRGKLLHCN